MPINLISKYRKQLMAFAMFWIGMHHSLFPFSNTKIEFLMVKCGYLGVALFFFLSGFSMYYSYQKDSDYLSFIKKRLLRILPFYIPIGLFLVIIGYQSFVSFSGIDFFFKNQLENWFTFLIIFVYLITPLYLKHFNKNPFMFTLIGIILVSLICVLINVFSFYYAWFNVAVYMLGLYFAYLNTKDVSINIFVVILSFVLGFGFLYFMYHNFGNDVLHVYPSIVIAPSMLLLLAFIFDKITIFNKFLSYIGNYTYEFYLINIPFVSFLYANYSLLYRPNIGFDYLINIAGIVGSVILAIIYHNLVNVIINGKRKNL